MRKKPSPGNLEKTQSSVLSPQSLESPQFLESPQTFGSRLLSWYDANRRDLPWRRTTDPYAIWISEVMLQQTQVSRVVEYYQRFLKTFPTVRHLAEARLDEVLKQWEGLGYYGRARAVHECARFLVSETSGKFPQTRGELEELPGFGPYTAAAVASIAFGEPVPALDANVIRVMSRYLAVSPATPTTIRKRIQTTLQDLLATDRAGDFNQAMMELGALVCRHPQPSCLLCPVSETCAGRLSGNPGAWPVKKQPAVKPQVRAACGVIFQRGKYLVVQRPLQGLLGGLWEFPGGRLQSEETVETACVRGIKEKTGILAGIVAPLTTVNHTFSHFRVELSVFHCRIIGMTFTSGKGKWVTSIQLQELAMTGTARKIRKMLLEPQ
ncbi:MAG: A/G-specific adenine glycosylase [Blastocatellia bacterium]|nr:A/G-specific adenine glycosylase [Blastocatellia bacterium]